MENTEVRPVGGDSPVGKNKIEITNPKQKEVLIGAGIAAAFIGVAGGAYALQNMNAGDAEALTSESLTEPVGSSVSPGPSIPSTPIQIYTDAPVANSVNNDMSFKEAFAAARAEVGPGGFFVWEGAAYNTYFVEEWAAMSPKEHAQFQASVKIPSLSTNPITIEETVDGSGGEVSGYDGDNRQSESASQDRFGDQSHSADNNSNQIDVADAVGSGGTNVVSEQTAVSGTNIVREDELPQPAIIEIDLDGDGMRDALVIDHDMDGLIEAIIIDTDGNQAHDMYLLDSDDMPGLDLVVITSSDNGVIESEAQLPIEDPVIIEPDSTIDTSIDELIPNQNDLLTNSIEALPDIDNNIDVSDFDDPQ